MHKPLLQTRKNNLVCESLCVFVFRKRKRFVFEKLEEVFFQESIEF